MARKKKEIKESLKIAQDKLAELERLNKEAEEEEMAQLAQVEADINAITEEKELFCGVILSQDDIVSIVSLALKSGESVKIPFKLYYNS